MAWPWTRKLVSDHAHNPIMIAAVYFVNAFHSTIVLVEIQIQKNKSNFFLKLSPPFFFTDKRKTALTQVKKKTTAAMNYCDT